MVSRLPGPSHTVSYFGQQSEQYLAPLDTRMDCSFDDGNLFAFHRFFWNDVSFTVPVPKVYATIGSGFHYHQDSIGELKEKNVPLLPKQPVVTTVYYEKPSETAT